MKLFLDTNTHDRGVFTPTALPIGLAAEVIHRLVTLSTSVNSVSLPGQPVSTQIGCQANSL